MVVATKTKPTYMAMPGIGVPTVNQIINKVQDYTGVDIFQKTRKREVVEARQLAMFFSKRITRASLAAIGEMCGDKDHATVLHACKTVMNLKETNKGYMAQYGKLFRYYKIID